MAQKQLCIQRFTPAGRVKAKQLVMEINQAGGQAKIGETWLDCGAGIVWETVLVYSKRLKLWYQALNPADFKAMNEGNSAIYHADIVKDAIR